MTDVALDNELDTDPDLNARCHASVTLSRLFPRSTNDLPRFGAEAVPLFPNNHDPKLSTRLNNGRRYVLSITSDDDEGDCVCGYAGGDGGDDAFSHFPRRVRCQPANYPPFSTPAVLYTLPNPVADVHAPFMEPATSTYLFTLAVPSLPLSLAKSRPIGLPYVAVECSTSQPKPSSASPLHHAIFVTSSPPVVPSALPSFFHLLSTSSQPPPTLTISSPFHSQFPPFFAFSLAISRYRTR